MQTIDSLAAHYDVVVVGGGVAAGACVTTLREDGFAGSIALFTAEPFPPYTRPGLSKAVLRGEKPPSAPLMRPAEWYAEHDVDLVMGTAVTNVDRLGGTVRAGGRTVGYGTLVLATGAEPRLVPVPTELADRVHVLRSIPDADRIRPHLGAGTTFLVVGGGFIGAELAASVRMTGSAAEMVFPEDVVMERAFGATVGAWFGRRLEAHGVVLHPGTTIDRLAARDDQRVVARLADGTELVADHVVVGIGVVPATGLAAQAGLELAEGGVAVDEHLRTADERIYAIGDIAAYVSELHGRRTRIEHWDVARSQGVHVARQLLGQEPGAYRTLPYFFSGMGDWAYAEYVGIATTNAVLRSAPEADGLSAAYLDDQDRLVGVIVVDAADDLDAARELVPHCPHMDRERLASGAPLHDCRRQG